MNIDLVYGCTYGDEGKGKCVNYLSSINDYDYVFRVNASTNASHCVNIDNTEYVTKQLPSIFNNDKAKLVVTNGTFLNLFEFYNELKNRPDTNNLKDKVFVASSTPIILPGYISYTKNSEHRKNVGSTNQGTGVAMKARVSKCAVYLYDLLEDFNSVVEKIHYSYESLGISSEESSMKTAAMLIDTIKNISKIIGDSWIVDIYKFINSIDKDSKILIEGCNGALLDNINGVRPYVTSCETTLIGILNYSLLPISELNIPYAILGAYTVCLNKRPFKTEITDKNIVTHITTINKEIDNAEMMQRRIGWFDAPAARRGLIGGGNKVKIFLTKLDVLTGLDKVKICDYYELDGKRYDILPDNTNIIHKLTPHYIELNGWKSINDNNAKIYVNTIEKLLNAHIQYISNGKDSNDTIVF